MLMPLPPPPAAALMSSGKPIACRFGCEGVEIVGRHHGRRHRHAMRFGEIARRDLVAHQCDGVGIRPDEGRARPRRPLARSRHSRTGIRSPDGWRRRRVARAASMICVAVEMCRDRRVAENLDRLVGHADMSGAGLDAVMDRDRCDAQLVAACGSPGRRSRRDWRSGFFGTGWPSPGVRSRPRRHASSCGRSFAPAGQRSAGLQPVRGHFDRQVHQDLRQRLALRVVAQRGDAAAAKAFMQQEVEAVEPGPFEPLDLALGEMREVVGRPPAPSAAGAAGRRIPAVRASTPILAISPLSPLRPCASAISGIFAFGPASGLPGEAATGAGTVLASLLGMKTGTSILAPVDRHADGHIGLVGEK